MILQRSDAWNNAGVFAALEQIYLEAYDRIIGLELKNLTGAGASSRTRPAGNWP